MSDQSPFGDGLELRLVKRPEGSSRSKSTGTPGAERDLLRDSSGALLGPTESFPVDTEELRRALAPNAPTRRAHQGARSAGRQMAVDIAADVAYVVIREAVAQVYQLVIAPKAREKWAELKRNRRSAQRQASSAASGSELVAGEAAPVADPSTQLVVQEPVAVMDSTEFRQRLALMLAAENFAAEQRRLLSAVQISDEADVPPQVVRAMRLVLEQNVGALDDVALQLLIDFLVSSDAELVERLKFDEGPVGELGETDDEG